MSKILQIDKLMQIEISIKNGDIGLALDWSRKQRTVQTGHGDRVERSYGLLWILDLGPDVDYASHADD